MTAAIKPGECYMNPILVPFRVVGAVDKVVPMEGEPFSAVIVEFAWPRNEYESVIELIERSIVEAWIEHEQTRVISEAGLRSLRTYCDIPLELTEVQKKAVDALWALYGNAGPKYSKGNHGFIRCYLQGAPEDASQHQPTRECILDFKKVLSGDYSMLSRVVRNRIEGKEQGA